MLTIDCFCIDATLQEMKGSYGGLTQLLEDWSQAGEDWLQSTVYQNTVARNLPIYIYAYIYDN